ncbi:hypothetical protein BDZ97DRAFT_2061890, partial [Flammula alnicola]
MDTGAESHHEMHIAQAVEFASFAALAAQTWELLVQLSDEVEYLWKGKFNFIKVLYFSSRYIMLLAQIAHQILSFVGSWRLHGCTGIFIFRATTVQLSMTLVEMILLIRVYTLYNRSFKVKCLLTGIFFTSVVTEMAGTGIIIRNLPESKSCVPPKAEKKGLVLFMTGAGLCQLLILVMSLNKLVARGRWSRTPLTSLMLREGIVAFLLVLGNSIFHMQHFSRLTILFAVLLTAMVVYEILRSLDIDVGNAAFSWYLTLMSMGASRLILNIRKIAATHNRRRRQSFSEISGSDDES